MSDVCGGCGESHNYVVNGETYSNIIGVEDPYVYDGVLYWVCPVTGRAFPRDFGFEEMRRKSKEAADRANQPLAPGAPCS